MANNIDIKISAKTDGNNEVKSLGSEIKGLSSSLGVLNNSLNKITAFKKLQADIKSNKKQLEEAKAVYQQYSIEIENTGQVSAEVRNKYRQAEKTLAGLETQYSKNLKKLSSLRSELKTAGVATYNLSNEEKRLKTELSETKVKIQAHTQAFAAYSTLGMKSFRDIRSEIAKQKQAYKSLAATDLGWKEKAKAYSTMKRNISDLRDQTNSWTKNLQMTQAGLLKLTAAAYGFISVGRGIHQVLKESDQSAFNLSSSIEAANREFKNTGSIEEWKKNIQELSREMKIYSESSLENAVSRTIDMTKRLGISAEQMKVLIKRTGDLSAGKVDLEGGIERVTAALRGEAESAEYLGLTLNENYVKAQYEANKANKKAWKDLTDLEKAQVRYQEVLKQTSSVQGRAAEYADTYAGAIQLVKTTIADAIKNNEDIVESLNNLAGVLRENSDEIAAFVNAFVSGISSVINFLVDLKKGYDDLSPSMKETIKIAGLGTTAFLMFGGKLLSASRGISNLIAVSKDSIPGLNNFTKTIGKGTSALKLFGAAGVIAAGVFAWKEVFEQIAAIKGWKEAVDGAKDAADNLYKTTAKVKEKYEEFKDIYIPTDIFKKNIDELGTLKKELGKAIAYWTATVVELEQKSKETDLFGNLTDGAREAQAQLENAKNRLNEVADAQKETTARIIKLEKEKTENLKKQTKTREELAKEAAEREKRVAVQMYQALKKEEEEYSELRNAEHSKQLAELDLALAQELISVKDANLKKAELEYEFAEKKLASIQSILDQAKTAYGIESEEYRKAIAEKTQAEIGLINSKAGLIAAQKKSRESSEEEQKTLSKTTEAQDKNTESVSKSTKEYDAHNNILVQVMRWLDMLREKYADQGQTQKEVFENLDEVLKKQNEAFSKIGNHPYFKVLQVVQKDVEALAKAFETVNKASEEFGFRIDSGNLSVKEAKELVRQLSENFNSFNQKAEEAAQSVYDATSELKNLGTEVDTGFDFGSLNADIASVASGIQELYNKEWINADEMQKSADSVLSSFEKIKSDGLAHISDLKSEWQSLADKISDISKEIAGIEEDTQDKIRELRRGQMTDEEQWQDRRAEYNEKISAASSAQSAGMYAEAVSLYKEAQEIAKSLAEEVKNNSGETVRSLEQTTKISIDLINSAAEGMNQALLKQKDSLTSQQQQIRSEIDKTSGALNQLANQIQSVNKQAGWMNAAGWDDAKWTDFWKSKGLDKYASGGRINGPSHKAGGVVIEAEGGEYIHPVSAVQHYGTSFMEAIRRKLIPKDIIPKFQFGGLIERPRISLPPLPKFASGGMVTNQSVTEHVHTINLNLNGKTIGPLQGSKTTVETFIHELQRAQALT